MTVNQASYLLKTRLVRLRYLVTMNKLTLVIDGSSSSTFVGLQGVDGKWLIQSSQKLAPLEGLFSMIEAMFDSTEYELTDIRSFVYCKGPGSVLGLRLCSMAIQTWGHLSKPVVQFFHYNSLELTAALLALDEAEMDSALLISDWKKDVWHAIEIRTGQMKTITTIDDQAVRTWNKGPLFYLPQRKGWQTIPTDAITVEYSPHRLIEVTHLLKETKNIELYASNINRFQKWVPQYHRA